MNRIRDTHLSLIVWLKLLAGVCVIVASCYGDISIGAPSTEAFAKALGTQSFRHRPSKPTLQAAQALRLGAPEFLPAAIQVSSRASPGTPVRFATRVSRVSRPPAAVELQAFSHKGEWKKVGELADDGRNGDLFAGDFVYARQLPVKGSVEGEKRYRVVARYKRKTVISEVRAIEITRFPVGPERREPEFIEDKETGQVFAGEQVLVSFSPSVSSDRIEEIVARVTRKVTGQAGSVIGYIPQIGVIQIGLTVKPGASEADRAAAVKAAVSGFESDDGVRYAQANFRVEFAAAITPDGETSPDCAAKEKQWGAIKIQADKAWGLAGTLSGPALVAVVDSGVKPSNDPTGDLCWGASPTAPLSARDPADCDPVNVLRDKDSDPDSAQHGTAVAGIIAAKHNGVGISGIAHGLPIISFDVGTGFGNTGVVMDKILAAANTTEVAIINFSAKTGVYEPIWRCALEYATYTVTKPVDILCAGRTTSASTGKGKLVVAAAGNQGIEFYAYTYDPVTDKHWCPNPSGLPPPRCSYPCSWSYLEAVLCVANTNEDDILHAGNRPSNYGLEVDLTAPGTKICTTASDGGYIAEVGTSFAVPHVAGAAVVLWSLEPGLTAIQVANRLKANADPIDSKNPSHVGKLGTGRLNLFKAINKTPKAVADSDTATEGGATVAGNVLSNDNPGNAPATVTKAAQGNSTIALGTTFSTAYAGKLTLNTNGNYTYAPPTMGNVLPGGINEVFSYTISDANGDIDTATLKIRVSDDPAPPPTPSPSPSPPILLRID